MKFKLNENLLLDVEFNDLTTCARILAMNAVHKLYYKYRDEKIVKFDADDFASRYRLKRNELYILYGLINDVFPGKWEFFRAFDLGTLKEFSTSTEDGKKISNILTQISNDTHKQEELLCECIIILDYETDFPGIKKWSTKEWKPRDFSMF